MKALRVLLALFAVSWFSLNAVSAAVNINTADAPTLAEELNGVGPKTAAAIVEFRESHGSFESVDDLINVKGIGVKILERNRGRLAVEDAPAATQEAPPSAGN